MSDYQTVNTTKNAEAKNWCLVLKAAKPIKQAGLKLGKNTYQYASNYEIQQGDVDIIIGTQIMSKGHHFPRLTAIIVLDIDYRLVAAYQQPKHRNIFQKIVLYGLINSKLSNL